SAVGQERDGFAQSFADQIGGGGEHFLHARTASGAFVPDDHHVPGFDLVHEDALGGVFFGFEDDGGAAELHHAGGDARGLQHAARGGDVAEHDGESAGLAVRILDRADHVFVFDGGIGDILAKGLAGDGDAVQM